MSESQHIVHLLLEQGDMRALCGLHLRFAHDGFSVAYARTLDADLRGPAYLCQRCVAQAGL